MEGSFAPAREEFYHVQMDIKQVKAVQNSHSDRILRLEKRQADDAALKSVWNSPFPSVLNGTPQYGPINTPSAEIFDDFDDEHGQNLLGSLQLEAEEEPVRRGASRANSVRFDVSAIQGSSCAQGSRSPGDLGPLRPSSGLSSHLMMERSLSHKSDGRHSSASFQSLHSALSGRTSSLGLDTNFVIGGHNSDSPLDMPEPPPGLFVLGAVPSIIRCWLNENFSHNALLYAVICTGSQNSHIDISLVKELGLLNQIQKNVSGNDYIKLPVYLPEALFTQPMSRTDSPAPQLPTLTATFNILGASQRPYGTEAKRTIRIFLGSDTLRVYNADVLFSRNVMTIYGDDRNRLSVPFVRPEDDAIFRNLRTAVIAPELKATAPPFTPTEQKLKDVGSTGSTSELYGERVKMPADGLFSNPTIPALSVKTVIPVLENSEPQKQAAANATVNSPESPMKSIESQIDNYPCDDKSRQGSVNGHGADSSLTDHEKQLPSGSIWGTWRAGGFPASHSDAIVEYGSSSGYQRPSRGGRSMKVLKPSKPSQQGRSSSAARTGTFYEPPIQRVEGDIRRKSQAGASEGNMPLRWEAKRIVSDERTTKDPRPHTGVPKSSNPVGGASAFAWMQTKP